jgi:hypothetical protein
MLFSGGLGASVVCVRRFIISFHLIRGLELVRGNTFSLVHLNSAHLLPLCVAITRVNINFLAAFRSMMTSAVLNGLVVSLIFEQGASHMLYFCMYQKVKSIVPIENFHLLT